VCALGSDVLHGQECAPAGADPAGLCIPEENIPKGDDTLDLPAPYMDLGSKRDFEWMPGSTGSTGSTGTGSSGTAGSTSGP
jgi:hypothetical protein